MGYCGIGIINGKMEKNLGTLWRSAYCLGTNFIFTIGDRYKHDCTDTTKAWRNIPYFRYKNEKDFLEHLPYDCQLIGIDNIESAKPLETFAHPKRAIYLLGAEDSGLPEKMIEECQHLIQFKSKFCVNVAVAGSIVLYDRQLKLEV